MLLASVVPGGGARGLGRDDLVRHVTAPGADPNRLHAGMDAFSRFGTNFHEREGRFFFDSEENEYAKVELEAVKLNDETARADAGAHLATGRVPRHPAQRGVPGPGHDPPGTRSPGPQASPLRAGPRRLSAPERHGLYTGLERRNQILLLEPRDARVDHLAHPDMLALARGIRAASQLAESASSGERRNRFERIARERTQEIRAPPEIGRARLRPNRRVGRGAGPDDLRGREPGLGEHAGRGPDLPPHPGYFPAPCSRSTFGTGSTTSSTGAWTGSIGSIAIPWASRSP